MEDELIVLIMYLVGVVLGFGLGLCISLFLNTNKSLQNLADAHDLLVEAEKRWVESNKLLAEAKGLLIIDKESR